ncbi:hypothetical protein J4558_04650 [Leptolyngbya sp. 15MV]|nr:hypothetical protein J4558_04650 [Leptolyngbya sp. 15MV]
MAVAHRRAEKSGLSIARYCLQHRLKRWTFTKWRRELIDWEEQKIQQKLASRRRYQPISPDKRRQATQAFCAMHVEAWQWSALHLRDYASALRMSSHSFLRWRNLIDAGRSRATGGRFCTRWRGR